MSQKNKVLMPKIKNRENHINYKTIVLLLGLTASFIITACQPKAVIEPTPTPSTVPTSTATLSPTSTPIPTPTTNPNFLVDPAQLSGITIHFSHAWPGETFWNLGQVVSEFNETNLWGIQVYVEAYSNQEQLLNRTLEDIQNFRSPDIITAPLDQLIEIQRQTNGIVDLNEYIEDKNWGLIGSEIADFNQAFLQQDEIKGYRLGLPAERNSNVIFYNQSWAEELGFNKPPSTPQEFKEQACAAAQALNNDDLVDNNGTGGWITDTDPFTVLSWILSFDSDKHIQFNEITLDYKDPTIEQAFTFLREMYDEGCAWNSRLTTPYDYFANRNALFYTGSLDNMFTQQFTQNYQQSTDNWMVLPFPSVNSEPVMVTYGSSYAILASTPEEQLAAWIFMRWLLLPRNSTHLITNNGSLPITNSMSDLLSEDFFYQYPQWQNLLPAVQYARSGPKSSFWYIEKEIISDASWQLFQPETTAESITEVIKLLEQTIEEITDYLK
jgi:ABC-type glycerol-3-phosphate transport system substrate-binding protein